MKTPEAGCTEERMQYHTCPDCKCQFVQPFVCTTCGAQKLYDETVRSQGRMIERLHAQLRQIEEMESIREIPDAMKVATMAALARQVLP
jgi:hypothetical protein